MPKSDPMKAFNFNSMTVDEMWQLYEEVGRVLSVRLASEKRELENRLARLNREKGMGGPDLSAAQPATRGRRKYPRVYPKYQNPSQPSETWSGRGKQPRWLVAALKTGRHIEDFVIKKAEDSKSSGQKKGHRAR
ncbi:MULTISPECIES: H-NS histone family protein [unclassified Bradyrhizobium]|nr:MULTISPECIES: H-NS histone family protein [unclassified Bradyrhizobium]